jgi:uncharacterized cofD-like protein
MHYDGFMDKQRKNIVVVGGGTGVFTVLSGLKKYGHNLSAIVSMADDGGSTGILREEFGILPPGDIRRALVALSDADRLMADLFNYRFEKHGSVSGHSFGNLLITALEQITGDFERAIVEAGKILAVRGEVIPVTLQKTKLHAKLENGKVVAGETNIDVPKHNPELRIKKIFLEPRATINPRATAAILGADIVVLGPGDLYTSVLPNFLVEGMRQALQDTKAKRIYICNIMTKHGETHAYKASDFIKEILRHTGESGVDYALVNRERPDDHKMKLYHQEHAYFVEPDKEAEAAGTKVIFGKFLRTSGSLLRHDPEKLARAILEIDIRK